MDGDVSSDAAAVVARHERVRLKKWGAPHLVKPGQEKKASVETYCGRRFFRGDEMQPRRDNQGTCTQCRRAALGKPKRVHIRRRKRPKKQRPTPAQEALERRLARSEETGVSDIRRSIDRNPESTKMGFKAWGRHMMSRVGAVLSRWTRAFGGKR